LTATGVREMLSPHLNTVLYAHKRREKCPGTTFSASGSPKV